MQSLWTCVDRTCWSRAARRLVLKMPTSSAPRPMTATSNRRPLDIDFGGASTTTGLCSPRHSGARWPWLISNGPGQPRQPGSSTVTGATQRTRTPLPVPTFFQGPDHTHLPDPLGQARAHLRLSRRRALGLCLICIGGRPEVTMDRYGGPGEHLPRTSPSLNQRMEGLPWRSSLQQE